MVQKPKQVGSITGEGWPWILVTCSRA